MAPLPYLLPETPREPHLGWEAQAEHQGLPFLFLLTFSATWSQLRSLSGFSLLLLGVSYVQSQLEPPPCARPYAKPRAGAGWGERWVEVRKMPVPSRSSIIVSQQLLLVKHPLYPRSHSVLDPHHLTRSLPHL